MRGKEVVTERQFQKLHVDFLGKYPRQSKGTLWSWWKSTISPVHLFYSNAGRYGLQRSELFGQQSFLQIYSFRGHSLWQRITVHIEYLPAFEIGICALRSMCYRAKQASKLTVPCGQQSGRICSKFQNWRGDDILRCLRNQMFLNGANYKLAH